MPKGTVRWFDKEQGFGFVLPDDGSKEVYVSVSQVDTPDNNLACGQRVEYEIVMGRKGPEASHVKTID